MTAMPRVAAASVYRFLLRLYPTPFYRQFAGDMSADFDDGYAAARCQGRRVVTWFILRNYGDLAVSLMSQWLRDESFLIAATSVSVAFTIWGGAMWIASHEWPHGPATLWLVIQLGVFVTACALLIVGTVLHREAVNITQSSIFDFQSTTD